MFILGLSTMLIGFPGPMELVIIFFIVLLLFGANKMPEIARSLGKGMREFKKASSEIRSGFEEEKQISSTKSSPEKLEAEKDGESKLSTFSPPGEKASGVDKSETADKEKSAAN